MCISTNPNKLACLKCIDKIAYRNVRKTFVGWRVANFFAIFLHFGMIGKVEIWYVVNQAEFHTARFWTHDILKYVDAHDGKAKFPNVQSGNLGQILKTLM